MHACMHACMYVCMCVCMYIHAYAYVLASCLSTCIRLRLYVSECIDTTSSYHAKQPHISHIPSILVQGPQTYAPWAFGGTTEHILRGENENEIRKNVFVRNYSENMRTVYKYCVCVYTYYIISYMMYHKTACPHKLPLTGQDSSPISPNPGSFQSPSPSWAPDGNLAAAQEGTLGAFSATLSCQGSRGGP